MAAPSHLFTHKVVSQKTGRADKLVLLTSAAESSTVLKTRFYLDGFFIREHNGVKKWAGYCIVGSTNYYMHAEARHSWLRERRNGQDIVVFWDAGLNTMGFGSIVNTVTLWANHIIYNAEYVAAYYNDTSNIGVRWKLSTAPTWNTTMFTQAILQGQTVARQEFFNPELQLGQQLHIQLINVNPEGTFMSPTVVLNLDKRVKQFDTYVRSTPCSTTGEVQDVVWFFENEYDNIGSVTTTSANTGIYAYRSHLMTTKYANTWLFAFDNFKAYRVDANGQITHYQECTPVVPMLYVAAEQDVNGNYVVVAYMMEPMATNVVVNGRLDVGDPSTSFAKPFTLVIPAGQTLIESAPYNLSDNTYRFYNVTSNIPDQTILTQGGNIN